MSLFFTANHLKFLKHWIAGVDPSFETEYSSTFWPCDGSLCPLYGKPCPALPSVSLQKECRPGSPNSSSFNIPIQIFCLRLWFYVGKRWHLCPFPFKSFCLSEGLWQMGGHWGNMDHVVSVNNLTVRLYINLPNSALKQTGTIYQICFP